MKNKTFQITNGLLLVALGLALVSLGVLLWCDSCTTSKPRTTEIVVLWDITEPHQPIPEAEEILALYNLSTDPASGAIFKFSFISDIRLNEETIFELPASAQNALTNQFDREREIELFQNSVTNFLDSLAMDTIGKNQSALYVPIANALNDLATSNSNKKIALLFTDLRENTSLLSFYNKQTLALMQTDTAQVAAMFEKQEPLNQLDQIEIRILFSPRDIADDASFAIVSRFYRGFFSSKGATVSVSANLNP